MRMRLIEECTHRVYTWEMGFSIGARDLRARVAEVLQTVQQGETVTLTHRGRPVAEIRPIGGPAKPINHDVFGMWAERDDMKEPGEWVRKGRRSRLDRSSSIPTS